MNESSKCCDRCGEKTYALGLCRSHWEKARRGTLDRPKPPTVCSYPECGRRRAARGLCSGHYRQWSAGQELSPLRAIRKGLHQDENGRVCTKCDTYKTWDNYYTRNTGAMQSKCKPCMIKQNTLINQRRAA